MFRSLASPGAVVGSLLSPGAYLLLVSGARGTGGGGEITSLHSPTMFLVFSCYSIPFLSLTQWQNS